MHKALRKDIFVCILSAIKCNKGFYFKMFNLIFKGSVWSLNGSKSVCQALKRNLNASFEDENVEKEEDIEDNFKLTSVYPRVFKSFSRESVEIATKAGIQLGRKLLGEGAKEILLEVKAAS